MLTIPAMDTTGGHKVVVPQMFGKIREVVAEADCHTLGLNCVYGADLRVAMIIIIC